MCSMSEDECDFLGLHAAAGAAIVDALPPEAIDSVDFLGGAEHEFVDFLGGAEEAMVDCESDSGGPLVDDLAADDAVEIVLAEHVAEVLPAAVQRILRGTAPQSRSDAQKVAIATHMRECKMQMALRREREARQRDVVLRADMLRSKLLRCHATLRETRNHVLVLECQGSEKHHRMTCHAWMRIAFEHQHASVATLAEVFGCSRPTIRAALILVVFFCNRLQREVLDCMRARASSPDPESATLQYAVLHVSFDETSKTMLLPQQVSGVLSKKQRRAALHVLVSLSALTCCWSDGGRSWKEIVSLVRPVVILSSTSAACLVEALTRAPQIAEQWEHAMLVLSSAQIPVLHWGRDGCAANDKALHVLMSSLAEEYPTLLQSDKTCSMHSNHLACGAVCALGMDVVEGLYDIAALCKGGTVFSRVLRVLPQVAAQRLVMRRGRPPAECVAYAAELVEHACSHFQCSASAHDAKTEATRAKVQYREHGLALVRVLNGPLWEDGNFVHFCSDSSCCDHFNRSVCLLKLLKCFIRFVLPQAPTSPELGKWTKLSPALHTIMLGMCFHGSYRLLFEAALEKSKPMSDNGALGMSGADLDSGMLSELAWHQVQGKREQKTLAFLRADAVQLRLVALSLALDPLRAIMRSLFACSSSTVSATATPAIAVFAHPAKSPFMVALQYCSSYCSSESVGRLQLLFRRAGCSSVEQFMREPSANEIKTFAGDLMLVCASWIYRRHYKGTIAWPWKLSVLVDDLSTLAERNAIVVDWQGLPPCCLDRHFSSRLKAHLARQGSSLSDPNVLSMLRTWASAVDMTTAQVEFRHARQKCLAPQKDLSTSFFAARACAAEVSTRFEAEQAFSRDAMRAIDRARNRDAQDALPPRAKVPKKGLSALQCFHQHVLARDESLGVKANPASSAFWAKVRDEWAQLSLDDETYKFCVSAAEKSSADARHHKMRQRQVALQGALVNAPRPDAEGGVVEGALVVADDEVRVAQVHPTPLASVCLQGARVEDVVAKPHGCLGELRELVACADCPVHASSFAQSFLQGRRVKDVLAEWRGLTAKVCGASKGFPESVEYDRVCGAMCLAYASAQCLLAKDVLSRTLEKHLVAGKLQKQCLMLEACVGGAKIWAYMPSWLAAAGAFAFRANMIMCHVVTEGEGGMRLQLSRAAREPPRLRDDPRFAAFQESPLNLGACGALQHRAEDEWAANLLRRLPLEDGAEGAWRLSVSARRPRRVSFDVFDLDDTCEAVFEFELSPQVVADHVAGRAKSKHKAKVGGFLQPVAGKHCFSGGSASALGPQGASESQADTAGVRADPDSLEEWLGELLNEHEMSVFRDLTRQRGLAEEMNVPGSASEGSEGEDDHVAAEAPDDLQTHEVPPEQAQAQENVVVLAPAILEARSQALFGIRLSDCESIEREFGVTCTTSQCPRRVIDVRDRCAELASDALLGTILTTFAGKVVQAVCKRHKACKLLLSVKPAIDLPEPVARLDAIHWLAAGPGITAEQHAALSVRVRKELYQMKIRT